MKIFIVLGVEILSSSDEDELPKANEKIDRLVMNCQTEEESSLPYLQRKKLMLMTHYLC